MKIEINIDRCFYCEHFAYDEEDDLFEGISSTSCSITNQKIKDNNPVCDKFKLSVFVPQELQESLGLRESDIKII